MGDTLGIGGHNVPQRSNDGWEHKLRKACPNGNLTGILVAPKYFQLFRRTSANQVGIICHYLSLFSYLQIICNYL